MSVSHLQLGYDDFYFCVFQSELFIGIAVRRGMYRYIFFITIFMPGDVGVQVARSACTAATFTTFAGRMLVLITNWVFRR